MPIAKQNPFTNVNNSLQYRLMRFFALQTDKHRVIEEFCHEGECVVHMSHYHGLAFLLATLPHIGISILLFAFSGVLINFGAPAFITTTITAVVWFWFSGLGICRNIIDWKYDFILVTTDKIILIDQTSIFKREIKPIHMENIGGVSTSTQYMNIFPFGKIDIHLKEGQGGDKIQKSYVPNARKVASMMSDMVTQYQRGKHVQNPQNEINNRVNAPAKVEALAA